MSRPIAKQSVSDQSATGAGEQFETKGHHAVGLAVSASNIEGTDTLTVVLEAKIGGSWLPVFDSAGNKIEITNSALVSGDGIITLPSFPGAKARANITAFTDSAGSDLTVDAWVVATGNANGEGYSPET